MGIESSICDIEEKLDLVLRTIRELRYLQSSGQKVDVSYILVSLEEALCEEPLNDFEIQKQYDYLGKEHLVEVYYEGSRIKTKAPTSLGKGHRFLYTKEGFLYVKHLPQLTDKDQLKELVTKVLEEIKASLNREILPQEDLRIDIKIAEQNSFQVVLSLGDTLEITQLVVVPSC